MKKSSGRVILQILSIVLGSVILGVSVFLMILGESITAVMMGLVASVYLAVRVLAAVKEKDKNGPLNVFAVVFIILFCLLCLLSINEISPSAVEETTKGGTPSSLTVNPSEKEESVVVEVAPVSSDSSSTGTSGKEEEHTESSAGAVGHADAEVHGQSESGKEESIREEDSSSDAAKTGEIPESVIAASATTATTETRIDTVSAEKEKEEESAPLKAEETAAEALGPVRIPSSPVFKESISVTPLPSAPDFIDSKAVSSLVPETPVVASSSAIVPLVPSFASSSSSIVPYPAEFGAVSSALVPSTPEMKEPRALLVELDVSVPAQEEEIDPWADFFFSDEDLALDDGIYYFTLFVNDFEEGDVEVLVENGEVFISASELSAYIYSYLEEASAERIFGGEYDYYSVDYLNYVGVDAWADTNFFEYYITLSSADMPVSRISIRGNSGSNVVRPINGAVTIDPVNYYVISSYSASASTSGKTGQNFLDNLRISLSSNNSFRFFDLYGSFSWSLSGGSDYVALSWGSYSFYKDIGDTGIRMRFGNVSPDSFSPSGTPIGIRFDKSSLYSSNKDKDDEVLIILEKDSDVVVYNQEREIYRRTLVAGRYILSDFILYSGSNDIRIVMTPLDGSESTEESFVINYSSSLLEKGELYYGAGYAFSRTVQTNTTERESIQVDLPWFDSRVLRYDLRDFAASGYLKVGLSDNLTGNFQLGVKGKVSDFSYKISSDLSSLNSLGSLSFSGNFTHSSTSSLYFRLSQQFSLSGTGLVRGLSLGVSYNRSDLSSSGIDIISPTFSISGAFGIFGWSVGASATVLPSSPETSVWVVSPSLSFSLGKVSFSVSSSMSGIGTGNITYSGRVSAAFRIKSVSTTVSTNGSDTTVSSSYSGDRYGLSAHVRTSDFTNLKSYSYSADFSSSTSLFSYGLAASTTGSFESISLSGSMGFASVFADGLMSFSSSVPSSFLLVRQKGALRGNTVSVALSNSSDSTIPSGYLGATLYKGLPSSGAANISLYSESKGGFSSAKAFDIFVQDTTRRGYVVTIEGEETYTVAGSASGDGWVWANGSSPLYKVEIDEYGYISLEATEEYVFSDRKGVFILSDLQKGTYGFDVRVGNSWYLMVVSITRDNNPALVAMLEGENARDLTPPDVYEGVIEMKIKRQISSEVFWFELYGEAQ